MTTVEALKSLYTALGGDSADVADINTNPDMINALCDVAAGGGENPNTVETITGTMANPWGDKIFATLASEIAVNNATAILQGSLNDLPAIGQVNIELDDEEKVTAANFSWANLALEGDGDSYAVTTQWDTDGTLIQVLHSMNGTVSDVTELAGLATTTLTIIHHPLPTA